MKTGQLEIINMTAVNTAKDLMGDRFPKMIEYFLEDTQMYMEEIKRGLTEQDLQTILISAHTIKSSAKQLGADRLSDIALQLESLCNEMVDTNNPDFLALEGLNEKLKNEIILATPELNKFC
ncbi:MAG: Hpt domain-containing protein [Rickettsiaceae bacterium]